MKKTPAVMLSVLLLILIPFKSFAYNNGNRLSVEVTPQSIPENTAFVDLLIKFDTDSEQYTEFNRQRLLDIENNELKISADSEIATYNQDGYRSYLFHFVGASVDNQIEYHKFVFDNLSAIEKCKTLKVAFLDEKGSIIKITSEAKFTHVVFAETDSVIVDGDVARTKLTVSPLVAAACVVPVLIALCLAVAVIVRIESKRTKPSKK